MREGYRFTSRRGSVRVGLARFVALALLSLIALGVRLDGIATEAGPLAEDAAVYHRLATNILDGKPYSRDAVPPFEPEWQRTFLYPAFVAAVYGVFGREPIAVLYVQAVLTSLVLVPLVWFAAERASPLASTVVAWVAAGLAVVNPLVTLATASLMREPLGAVLFTALVVAVAWAWRTDALGRWMFVGVLAGLCVQNRIEYLVCAGAIPGVVAWEHLLARSWSRRMWVSTVGVVGPVAAILAPWIAYTYAHFGSPSPTAQYSAVGAANRAGQLYEPSDAETRFGILLRVYGIEDSVADDDWEASYALLTRFRADSGMTTVEALRTLDGPAREVVRRHRWGDLRRAAWNAVNSMLGYTGLATFVGQSAQRRFERYRYQGLWEHGYYGTAAVYILARFAVAFLVGVGTIVALVWWVRRPGPGLVVLGTAIMIAGAGSYVGMFFARARAPFDPLVVWAAAVGWSLLWHYAVRWVRGRWGGSADRGGQPAAPRTSVS